LKTDTSTSDRIVFDAEMALGNLIQLSREEALSVGPDKLASVLESPGRMARDVHGLLKLVSAVNAIQGLIWLERPLFELILDVIPADRGALVLTEGTESLPRLLAWNKDRGSQSLRICKQMTDRVLCEGLALSSNAVASQNDAAPRSVMAAPLIVFDRALGFVYLETTKSDIRFDAGHLHMLVIIAAIAATVLENARHLQRLEKENQWLRDEVNLQHAMVGESPRMHEIYQFVAKVAASDSTILLLGESGTGKELVARAIHQSSPRNRQPFVAINCAAITETLLESELFGYEKGAFTGATQQTRGKLEVAEGGSVFLDEIGELASPLQAKLLRVLQEHEVTRVGGTRAIKLNLRLIAATNRNLEDAVRQGVFRRDLYYGSMSFPSPCLLCGSDGRTLLYWQIISSDCVSNPERVYDADPIRFRRLRVQGSGHFRLRGRHRHRGQGSQAIHSQRRQPAPGRGGDRSRDSAATRRASLGQCDPRRGQGKRASRSSAPEG